MTRNPFKLKNNFGSQGLEIANSGASLDFEESLMDKESGDFLQREREGKFQFRVLWALIIICFVIIFAKLQYLTVAQHEFYRGIALGNGLRVEYLPAPRGGIYDRAGEIIAANKPSFELVAQLLDLPKSEDQRLEAVALVSEIIDIPAVQIESLVNTNVIDPNQTVLIKQNLSREEALVLVERSSQLPGFRVVDTPIRQYKDAMVFSHILGYVGKVNSEEFQDKSSDGYLYNDSIGKTGLEQIYEKYLRGTLGHRQVEVDSRGEVKRTFGEKISLPGNNVYLNIDAELQAKLYESLAHRLTSIGRKAGAAIAINPQDGRILALLSMPAYDNNLFAEGISIDQYAKLQSDKSRPLFNRAVGGTYPPGSTVKPMVATAALQEGVVDEHEQVEDKGHIVVENIYGGPDYFFYGYNRSGLGAVDVRRAIALSSDIFFYVVGGGYESEKIAGLGINKLAEYYKKFKLGDKLGIDLPGEAEGLVPTPEWKKEYFAGDPVAERWYLGDTYHVSIGQGDLLATPLQVLSWTATLANGGRIFRPFLVDKIQDQEDKIVAKNEPEQIGVLSIDQKNIQIAREGMRQVVTEGTAKSLQQLPITSAGKTGTSQFDAKNLSRTHAWFTAFAPYENPEIAIMVLIEDGGEGGTNAVPVVRETLDWWAKNRYLKK
ncbi:MAG: penicillin-binding protein 2 [bacterium]|nr:penicillin-binding protein 2 [bacterium]